MSEIGVVVNFDGACEPRNPGGTGGWGFVARSRAGKLAEERGILSSGPDMTNNVAEFTAALRAVEALIGLGVTGTVFLRGDSMLVIRLMQGEWQANGGAYVPIFRRLQSVTKAAPFVCRWQWVPREQNAEADDLSKAALIAAGVTITVRRKRA